MAGSACRVQSVIDTRILPGGRAMCGTPRIRTLGGPGRPRKVLKVKVTAKVTMPGLMVADHVFTVPLDHADPGGRTIEVLAREVRDPAVRGDLPWALYLEGGPGHPSPRLTGPGRWRHLLKT